MQLETERLIVTDITMGDAPFFLELLNSPSYIKFIGDKNVHSLEAAEDYIKTKVFDHHKEHGFGYYKVIDKENSQTIGTVGYINRKELGDIDIGFAFLPAAEGKGYGFEASKVLMQYGIDVLKFTRIVAIVQEDNPRSIKLLEKLGLSFEKKVNPFEENEELLLFATNTKP